LSRRDSNASDIFVTGDLIVVWRDNQEELLIVARVAGRPAPRAFSTATLRR
jgi:hypothetical protein